MNIYESLIPELFGIIVSYISDTPKSALAFRNTCKQFSDRRFGYKYCGYTRFIQVHQPVQICKLPKVVSSSSVFVKPTTISISCANDMEQGILIMPDDNNNNNNNKENREWPSLTNNIVRRDRMSLSSYKTLWSVGFLNQVKHIIFDYKTHLSCRSSCKFALIQCNKSKIKIHFPPLVERVTFEGPFHKCFNYLSVLPNTIKCLYFANHIFVPPGDLPQSLVHLDIWDFWLVLKPELKHNLIQLPKGLQTLNIRFNQSRSLKDFSKSLQGLTNLEFVS